MPADIRQASARSRLGPCTPLLSRFQQSCIAKGEIASFGTDNDVVQDLNTQQFASVDQLGGDRAIFPTGLRIAARMIVSTDDGGRVGQDGGLKDFAQDHNTS